MDKKLILSVAGSGKTTFIINSLSLDSRALVLTYTDNNYDNLRKCIIKKFGILPEGIKVYKYFSFLYSFCYKPFLYNKIKAKGYNWDTPPEYTSRLSRSNIQFYLDRNNRLYHNRVAKILEQERLLGQLNQRIAKYFDTVYVDEVQDFAGHDFNLLKSIVGYSGNTYFVGDYYQHTYDTSRDGNVNANLHKSFFGFVKNMENAGVEIDVITLAKSYRCPPNVCSFIENNLGISIKSHRDDCFTIQYLSSKQEIENVFNDASIVKLFYQKHYQYGVYSQNWGSSKGIDHYRSVCVVLNDTTLKHYRGATLIMLNPKTKSKFYVACSRAREHLYFVSEALVQNLLYADIKK